MISSLLMRRVLREFRQMDIEEQILSGGSLLAALSVFFPWFGGDWFGESVMWNGLQFYTSVVGFLVLIGQLFVFAVTILPLFGHALVTPARRDVLRFVIGTECVLLLVVAISIFAKIALESPRVETRFGIYMSLVSSIVVALYSFLRIQQHRRREVEEFFSLGESAEEKTLVPKETKDILAEAAPRVVGTIRIPRERPRPAVSAPPPEAKLQEEAESPPPPVSPPTRPSLFETDDND